MGSTNNKVFEPFLWPLKCLSTVRVGICVWGGSQRDCHIQILGKKIKTFVEDSTSASLPTR